MNNVSFFCRDESLIRNLAKAKHYEIHVFRDHTQLFDLDKENSCMVLFHLDSLTEDFRTFFKYLKEEFPAVKLMLIVNNPDVLEGITYLKEGVKGYGNAYMQPVHIEQALDVVCEGNSWIYPELTSYMIMQTPVASSSISQLNEMDDREKEIINFICDGLRNKQIAQMLNLSEISIKKALSVIYGKLHVKDRMELVALFHKKQ